MITERNIGQHIIALQEASTVWMPTRFGEVLGEIITQNPPINGRVLELGSGSGVLCVVAGKYGASVTALDINPAALTATSDNWQHNGLDAKNLDVRHSDLFSAMRPQEHESYSLLISNPPTFPGLPQDRLNRDSRDQWELAGDDGREILDAVITQGGQWVQKGGRLLTIATSKQGWNKTVELMNQHWATWRVVKSEDLPLAEHYAPFIPLWVQKSKEMGENLIFEKNGIYYQTLYFLEGTK